MDWEDLYDILHEVVGVSTEALDLAFGLKGCSEQTAIDILYYCTGWNSFAEYLSDIGFFDSLR